MNYDFLIIGGGLAGCSLAYELKCRGATVAIVEKRRIGRATSAVNQGGVRQQFSQPHNIIAGRETVKRMVSFKDEFGVDPHFRQAGYLLLLSTAESVKAYQAAVKTQNSLGVETVMLKRDEARNIVPRLNTQSALAACFCPSDGYVDPGKLMQGYEAGLRKLGVDIYDETDVVSLSRSGGHTITTTRATLGAGALVNAAGPWARAVARLLGTTIPVQAHQSSIYVLKPTHSEYAEIPLTIDIDRRVTLCPHADGVMVGNSRKPKVAHPGEVPSCEWSELPIVRARAQHLLEDLGTAPAVKGWAGYWEVTPDDDPIIGATEVDNVYAFAGFSGHGISIIPGLAPAVAQLLLGEKPSMNLAPFSPLRFGQGIPTRTEIWGGTAIANAESAEILNSSTLQ